MSVRHKVVARAWEWHSTSPTSYRPTPVAIGPVGVFGYFKARTPIPGRRNSWNNPFSIELATMAPLHHSSGDAGLESSNTENRLRLEGLPVLLEVVLTDIFVSVRPPLAYPFSVQRSFPCGHWSPRLLLAYCLPRASSLRSRLPGQLKMRRSSR